MSNILQSQAEYRARKWAVSVDIYDQSQGGFAATFRFAKFSEAVAYLRQSVRKNATFRDKRWELNGPGGNFSAEDVAFLAK